MTLKRTLAHAVGLTALIALAPVTASADDVADFYSGNTITIYTAGGASGPYNILARTIEPYLTEYLPGNPSIVVQAMAGAGGVTAANYLYGVAPKDGTAIGIMLPTIALNQAFGVEGLQYDATEFNYLTSVQQVPIVVGVWHEAPAQSIEEARETEVVLGSSGVTSNTYIVPQLMNEYLGTQFNIVTGYQGVGPIELAIERGEVDGTATNWTGFKSSRPQWLEEGLLNIIAQTGLNREPDLPDVPTLIEMAENDEEREIFEFYALGGALGRVFVAPPGIPDDRLDALRQAFADLMSDPDFLADAASREIDPTPMAHEDVQALVEATINFDPDVIATVQEALAVTE